MYRWRCTEGGGNILLTDFVADRFKPVIRFNLIHFSADRSGAYMVAIHVQVEMYGGRGIHSIDRFCGR
jgi:hypothetical protein